MRIGVLTGGGDCPGLNAVIRAVTKSLLRQCGVEIVGIEDGFAGLMQGRWRRLDWQAVSGILFNGGTILGTSNRADPLASGGDGTMAIAHGMTQRGLRCVGVPKTIDNDIAACERSFGFDTAVATVTEALERVQTTGQSHSRVMIVETMGRYAGWIALEAGIAGAADVILLPEFDYDPERVLAVCREREQRQRYTVICIGEGAKPIGGELTIERRVDTRGGADPIRLGGVAHRLRDWLEPRLSSEVRATVLGHVQRGGSPTPFDRVLATQFGMVTLRDGRMGAVPIAEVAGQNRRITADEPLLATARQIGICLGH